LGFLALLQVMAVTLNLLPLPPLDGYGVISPYLPAQIRQTLDQAGGILILLVFALLWYVPLVSNAFWNLVYGLFGTLGIPLQLAGQGLTLFQFWRR
jgi:Zn-dependent protease